MEYSFVEKNVVPLDLAIQLKELGFNLPCIGGWNITGTWHYHPDSDIEIDGPLYQQAISWLLEEIDVINFDHGFLSLQVFSDGSGELITNRSGFGSFNFNDLEECVEFLIKHYKKLKNEKDSTDSNNTFK
jgi:hypothetical protein